MVLSIAYCCGNTAVFRRFLAAEGGLDVRTEDQLEEALLKARTDTETFYILDIHLSRDDRSPALQRLTDALKKRVKD